MKKRVKVYDPRGSANLTAFKKSERSIVQRVREKHCLLLNMSPIWMDDGGVAFIRGILSEFRGDRIFVDTWDQLPKVMKCLAPEEAFNSHAGLSTYGVDVINRFMDCLPQYYLNSFEWLFGVYLEEHHASMQSLARTRMILVHGSSDELDQYIPYHIHCGTDMNFLAIQCNLEDLFDPFIEYVKRFSDVYLVK